MKTAAVTLYSRPGCHLCEDAAVQLRELAVTLSGSAKITIEETSILSDPELEKKYSDYIPVILINGEPHDFFRVDPERFISAINSLPE
jgi:glutaredoxin